MISLDFRRILKKNRLIICFFAKLLVLLFGLFVLNRVLIYNPAARDWFVNSGFIYGFMKTIAICCKYFLNLLGYPAIYYYSHQFSVDHGLFAICVPPDSGIYIGIQCLAFALCSVFTILIISFPGKPVVKIIYIVAGVLVIELTNVLRFCYLVVASKSLSETAGTKSAEMTKKLIENHHDNFNLIVYGIITIMFIIYVKYFSNLKKEVKK